MRILVGDSIAEEGVARLRAEPGIEVDVRPGLCPDELKSVIGTYDALIVRSATRVTREIIGAGSHLKVIGRAGVGLDNIDVQAAQERGVRVCNTPGATAVSVAELVMGHMLAAARHIVRGTVGLREGRWEKNALEGVELFGKTLGIVGIGRIGKEVARRARAFGMSVQASRSTSGAHRPDADFVYWNLKVMALEALLASSDFITLHLPLNERTRGMIGEREFRQMKKGVIFVNCARGGIVDETALYDALKSGHVASAALDVFDVEPLNESRLLSLDNFIATPHIGASAREAQTRAAVEIAEIVLEVLKTPPGTPTRSQQLD